MTDILQWLMCYAAMVGVLSKAYPSMVPKYMSYQAMIIKCAQDFEGLAWAQYNRMYRCQMAQTKELRWSKLNLTLYSLCFAGKAECHIVCSFCLSDTTALTSAQKIPTCYLLRHLAELQGWRSYAACSMQKRDLIAISAIASLPTSVRLAKAPMLGLTVEGVLRLLRGLRVGARGGGRPRME